MKKYILLPLIVMLISCSDSDKDFDATGVFWANEVVVSSRQNGQIEAFNVSEGDKLTDGQVLGYIDTTQLYLKKMQLIASLAAIKSKKSDIATQIGATIEQISTQKREKQRFENLFKNNAATQKQIDDLSSSIAVLEKQLQAQKSTLEKANTGVSEESVSMTLQIAQIEDQIKNSIIVSPIEGSVLTKYAEKGEFASVGKPLFKIANMSDVYLKAYVTSDALSKLKLGQDVKVYADYGKEQRKEYAGKITYISNQAEFTPKTIQTKDERANLVYMIKISVKNDGYIKMGNYGEMKFL